MATSSKKIDENYFERKVSGITKSDVDNTLAQENEIEQKIKNAGVFEKYAEMAKQMLLMLKDYRRGLYTEVPWFTIGSIVFSLIYVLNPLDVVPDFIPGLGYIDDLSVFTFALRFIESDLHNYLDWKINKEK